MLAGAWGARAGELLEMAAESGGASIHRVGALTMLEAPPIVAGKWYCWLFGEPGYRDGPGNRFEHELDNDPRSTFGRALIDLDEQAYELLRGRFVVVAYDRERDRCLVTRDQLGAQPLLHALAADGTLFAEHERDLLRTLASAPAPDRLALLQWIENGMVPARRTLYEGMHRLPAGHRLLLEERRAHVERWWHLRYEGVEEGGPAALATRVRETTFAAVGRAAAGAQRPAVKLSGGLDSAGVAAGLAASGLADGRARALGGTFSAYPDTDESELIEATARHAHLPLELLAFDSASSMLAPALAHIARWRLPPATPNLFLWQPMMARARELGIDLLLDGEGGDELFGLAAYLIADTVRSGHLRRAWRLTGEVPGIGLAPSRQIRTRVLRHYGLKPLLPLAVRVQREKRSVSPNSLVPRTHAQALVELRLAAEADRRDGPSWWRLQAESLIDTRDLLDVGGHFRREAEDEAVERRHPFLYDVQLVEAMLRLPPEAQFDPVRDRPLLREALTGLIPEAVRTRHAKSYFSPLVLAGMRADEQGLIAPLGDADAPVREYVATAALERKLSVAPGERSMLGAGSLWRVAIANRWLAFEQDAPQ
jgi:asparagine synthase (glutamine-hydrolysing)